MKNDTRKVILYAFGLFVGMNGIANIAFAANTSLKGVTINGVALCDGMAKASEVLKKQGFLKNMPDSQISQSVKSNILSGQKSESGAKYRFAIMSTKGTGKVDSINYRVTGLKDMDSPFEEARVHIQQVSGLKLGCLARNGGKFCKYAKDGNSVNLVAATRGKPKLTINIMGNCPP